MSSFWDKRYEVHGHTGWSDEALYEYDQKARLNAIEEIIDDLKFNRFLDIGCGSGDFTKLCLNNKNLPTGLGVDISKKVVEALKEEFKPLSQVQFQQIDLTKDTLPLQEFDLVICVTVLQHLGNDHEIKAAINTIKSSMKPGGYLLVLENIYGDLKEENDSYIRTNISSEDWKYFLKAGGMQVKDVCAYNHWGVVLTESFQSLLTKITRRKRKSVKSSKDLISTSTTVASSGVKKRLKKLVFAIAYVLDHVLKLPVPGVLKRYEIFVCIK